MAKLNRERGLAERRLAKQARKAARKQAAADGLQAPDQSPLQDAEQPLSEQPPVDAAPESVGDTDEPDAQEQERA